MKRLSTVLLLSLLCALTSCETKVEEKLIYEDPTYDVSSISLSESSLLFQTKATGLKTQTLTLTVDSEAEIPAEAFHAVSLDESVATVAINDEGELVVTPVATGITQIVATLQNRKATCDVEVRTTYFDLNFAKAIVACLPEPTLVLGDDGDIDIVENAAALAEVRNLIVYNCGLTSVFGLEYLTGLEQFDCGRNNITSLDLSACKNTLEQLVVSRCDLESLNLSGYTKLKELDCRWSNLTSLDLSGCVALENLKCNDNDLTSLDVSEFEALDLLYCSNNNLTSLDLSHSAELVTLQCSDNSITSLDLSACTKLDNIFCQENSLSTLDISMCKSDLSYILCGLQEGGEMTLSMTQSQYDGMWQWYYEEYNNRNVKTEIVDARK